jgi:hypothetical protein
VVKKYEMCQQHFTRGLPNLVGWVDFGPQYPRLKLDPQLIAQENKRLFQGLVGRIRDGSANREAGLSDLNE